MCFYLLWVPCKVFVSFNFHFPCFSPVFLTSLRHKCIYTGIFPSTFKQPVNCSKNSILNWVMKFSLFMFFVCLFVCFFLTPLKKFSFYSPIFITLWFRYLQTHLKESSMYLSSQHFFKIPHKTLKSQEKSKKTAFSNDLSQPSITYSRLTIETQEQVWNMFKVNNKDTRTTPLISWLLTLNIFHILF